MSSHLRPSSSSTFMKRKMLSTLNMYKHNILFSNFNHVPISSKILFNNIPSHVSYIHTTSAIFSTRTNRIEDITDTNVLDKEYTIPTIVFPPAKEFLRLGVFDAISSGLASKGLSEPTPVQKAVIPRLLAGENIVMAASTGSGKTLAYLVPIIQSLIAQEKNDGYKRLSRRPRCLVLVPTRELARQVLSEIKTLSHLSKISSAAVIGGEQYTLQKKSLDKLVDIVVASPGRLMQHKEQGNVYLSHVDRVIIDEVDTMLTQGFGADIRAILRTVLNVKTRADERFAESNLIENKPTAHVPRPVQLVMATATLTKSVRSLLSDVQGEGGFNIEFPDPSNKTPKKLDGTEKRVTMKIVELDGLHRSLPNVKHMVEHSKGSDKLELLVSILSRSANKNMRTMIFCNTIDSCRAVEYALNDAENIQTKSLLARPVVSSIHSSLTSKSGSIPGGADGAENKLALCYHGDLNSREREANLAAFREGSQQFLVCTDIAARGLDIPEIDHVIMFDYPLNPVDYLHRSGRCGRAGRKGLVTSILTKRDEVLAEAIQGAMAKGLPLDSLSSNKKDYMEKGKLASVVGRRTKEQVHEDKAKKLSILNQQSFPLKKRPFPLPRLSSSRTTKSKITTTRSNNNSNNKNNNNKNNKSKSKPIINIKTNTKDVKGKRSITFPRFNKSSAPPSSSSYSSSSSARSSSKSSTSSTNYNNNNSNNNKKSPFSHSKSKKSSSSSSPYDDNDDNSNIKNNYQFNKGNKFPRKSSS
eukprot:gene14050-18843_t